MTGLWNAPTFAVYERYSCIHNKLLIYSLYCTSHVHCMDFSYMAIKLFSKIPKVWQYWHVRWQHHPLCGNDSECAI